MNITEFKTALKQHPDAELRFVLPDDDLIPAHAHITEVGRIDKTFLDCGGAVRRQSTCLLQAWVADDVDHRLSPSKLADVIEGAAPILLSDDLPVEIEFEDCSITQFPVESASSEPGVVIFRLGEKHTDCLAKDVCIPGGKGGDSGCC
jgi:hypothetical protein